MRIGEPVLSVTHLRHRYGAREIFKDVSLTVHHGDRLGLLGVNGAGKTTLLRIMADAETPDGGEVTRARGLTVGYLAQEFALDEEKTVRESVEQGVSELRGLVAEYEALSRELAHAQSAELLQRQTELGETLEHRGAWQLDRVVETIMRHLRVPAEDRVIGTLSGGERRRVSLARALVSHPDLLILDEPTNHLDADSIAWLEGYLASYTGACLLVTHDRYFLDRAVNRMVELAHGEIKSYQGNYSDYLEAKAIEIEVAAGQEQSRQNTLRRELAWVRKQPRARMAKSKSREEAYYDLAAAEPPATPDEIKLKIPTGEVRLGKKILELSGVGKTLAGKRLFSDLSLGLVAGDRIGVVGPNGLGKTTLMRMIQGLMPPDEGSIEIGPNTRFVYADQGRDRLDLSRNLVDEVAHGGQYITVDDEQLTVRNYLKRFLFTDEQLATPMEKFSGGEQNRAQLAKLLAVGGNVLILDEPTNDLDLQTLRALEDGLLDYSGCAFIVSHDRYFLNRVATAILAFEGDGRVTYHVGHYDSYLERLAASEAAKPAPAPEPAKAQAHRPAKDQPRKLSYKETKELESMESAILEAEERLAEREALLGDPGLYSRPPEEVKAATDAAEAARAEVEGLYRRWEALEAIRDGAASTAT